MTTPAESPYDVGLVGNGTNTSFPYTFVAFNDDEFRVFKKDTVANTFVELTLTTDYTVTYNGSNTGGTIETTVAPTGDETINIFRNTTPSQEDTYFENTPFPAKNVEKQLDKITRIDQEQTNDYYTAINEFDPLPGGGGAGEVNTSSNEGAGAGLALPKVGSNLPFKSLVGGSNVSLDEGSDTITINATGGGGGGGESNTASNLGTGKGTFAQKNGVDLQFKSLVAGTNITLGSNDNEITINATGGGSGGGGEANTAVNIGTGEGLFAQKNGVDLEFKSLVGGTNINFIAGANDIVMSTPATINSPDSVLLNRANHVGTQLASTISDFDDAVETNPLVILNTNKVSNATHTGEVTGAGSLTVQPTAISNKPSVTAAAGMEVLVNDAGTLRKVDADDFLGGGGGGGILQQVETFLTSGVSTSTPIPYDNTPPQSTEGTEIISLSITPLSPTSSLYIGVFGFGGGSSVLSATGAIFEPSASSDAIIASSLTAPGTNLVGPISVVSPKIDSTGTTERTFTFRIGTAGSGTYYISGSSAANSLYGTAGGLLIRITEIE